MHPQLNVREIIAGFPDAQAFLAGLFEASPVSMQVYDAAGRSILVNRAFERLFRSIPPPDYNIFEDDIAAKTGVAELVRRAYAGEVVTTPPVWYDPRALTNVKVTEGRRVAIVVTFFPLRDAAGKVSHVVLIHQDVTELKTQQESLATTLRSIGDAVIATDADGRVTTLNPVAEQLTGWPMADAAGRPLEDVFRIISESDGRPVASPVEKVLREGVIVGMANHTAIVHRDGRHIPIADSAAPIKGEDGKLSGVVLVFRDATVERKAAGELRASEEKLRALLDNAPIVLWSVDPAAVFQMAGGAGLKSVGLRPEDLVGKQFFDMFADMPDAAHLRQALKGEPQQYKTTYAGRTFDVSMMPQRDEHGRVSGVITMNLDVTARAQSEERFRRLLEVSPDAIFVNVGGTVAYVNTACLQLFGADRPEQLVGKPVLELFHSDTHPLLRRRITSLLEKDSTAPLIEERIVRLDGKLVEVEVAATSYVEGGSREIQVVLRSLAERRLADARFRIAVEASPSAELMSDAQGRIMLVNTAAEKMFGYSRDELMGRPVEVLLPQRLREVHQRERAGYMQEPQARPMGAGRELVGLRKDGAEISVEVALNPIETQEGLCVLASIADISERKRLEAEQRALQNRIQHAQKLESLGVLAGGIAHDFNNLLMAVMGNAELALMRMTPESAARANVEQIEVAARRAADLTRQMLAYSGKGKVQLASINLTTSVQEMAHLLQVSISKRAVLKYNFAPNMPLIEADPGQITQIVMNLITNASEAIGEKSGIITVSTGVMEADRDYLLTCICDDGLPGGVYAYVEVSDTGVGMSPETKTRIFEPFFTTKFTGRGLGLSAVQGIVRGHKGALRVYSELGRGTTIKVLFPVSARAAVAKAAARDEDSFRGQGTILVVDDEESIRTVAKMILEEFGFGVMTAGDGLQALQVYREAGDKVSAVLLDMTMPHMDGEECFRELRRMRADVRVILSSGYSEQDATVQFAGKGLAGFLQKPYRPVQLIDMLRRVLGQG